MRHRCWKRRDRQRAQAAGGKATEIRQRWSRRVAVGACAALLLCGCAFTTNRPQPKSTLAVVADDLKQVDGQIEAVRQSLLELRTSEAYDIKTAYTEFRVNAERLERLGTRLKERFENMRLLGLDYFSEWDIQGNHYIDPRIHMLSPEQVDDLSDSYLAVIDESANARSAFSPFLFDVKALGNIEPVNANKVEYLDNIIEKTDADGESAQEAIERVLEDVATVDKEMDQYVPPAPAQETMPRRMEQRNLAPPAAPGAAPQRMERRMEQQ